MFKRFTTTNCKGLLLGKFKLLKNQNFKLKLKNMKIVEIPIIIIKYKLDNFNWVISLANFPTE